jgi:hypothetical protein
MDKLKNNLSWIVLNSPTQNDPKKVERNNVIYKKQNSKNDPKSIINNIQKINYVNSTQHISKIEFLIIRINQRSQSIADISIINKLMNRYEEKNILEKKQSSLKLEEVKEEIQIIENKISDTINRLNTLFDKKNEYENQQSSLRLEEINNEIEMQKNKLSNL